MGKLTADEVAQAIANGDLHADDLVGTLQRSFAERGFAIVPIEPSQEMLKAAWADALAEDARGVWREMIKRHLTGKDREF